MLVLDRLSQAMIVLAYDAARHRASHSLYKGQGIPRGGVTTLSTPSLCRHFGISLHLPRSANSRSECEPGQVTLPLMRTLRGEDVDQGIPGDVRIVGIRWLNDANDVAIELEFPGGRGTPPHGTLLCTWASDVRIDLDLQGLMGTVPTFQHEVVWNDGRWRVVFDIQPGLVSLLCDEVALSIAEPNTLGS